MWKKIGCVKWTTTTKSGRKPLKFSIKEHQSFLHCRTHSHPQCPLLSISIGRCNSPPNSSLQTKRGGNSGKNVPAFQVFHLLDVKKCIDKRKPALCWAYLFVRWKFAFQGSGRMNYGNINGFQWAKEHLQKMAWICTYQLSDISWVALKWASTKKLKLKLCSYCKKISIAVDLSGAVEFVLTKLQNHQKNVEYYCNYRRLRKYAGYNQCRGGSR